MMNDEQLTAWAAGMLDAGGYLINSVEQGPTRMYRTITLLVVTGDSKGAERLITAAGNGNVSGYSPQHFIWELQGIDAIRGFLEDMWPLLMPTTRSKFNMEIKRYRLYASGKLAS